MRPLVVLLGIVMGSTVSIAAALLLTGVVFLLLPEYGARLAEERRPLLVACLLSVLLAAVAAASFYAELRVRSWRFPAHGALLAVLAVAAVDLLAKNMRRNRMNTFERSLRHLVPALLAGFVMAVRPRPRRPDPIDEAVYRAHIARLASDEFGGRKPGTEAEKLTLDYLEAEFRKFGPEARQRRELPAGGADGRDHGRLRCRAQIHHRRDVVTDLKFRDDMVIWTKRVKPAESMEASPMVFVGHGVTAPEYGWDDYAGIDMHGKTAVILINDPGFATERCYAVSRSGDDLLRTLDLQVRGGRAARRRGRHHHPPDRARRVWLGHRREQLVDAATRSRHARMAMPGAWPSKGGSPRRQRENCSRPMAPRCDAVKRANTRGFRAEPLKSTASAALRNAIRRTNSHNLAAVLPGAKRPDEDLVYMAHWDHLGRLPGCSGDCIMNGAVDNATGTSGLLTHRQGLHEGAAQARALDRVPRRDARRVGPAGFGLLRRQSAVPARADRRGVQHGCLVLRRARPATSPWSTSAPRSSRSISRRRRKRRAAC